MLSLLTALSGYRVVQRHRRGMQQPAVRDGALLLGEVGTGVALVGWGVRRLLPIAPAPSA